MEINFYGDVCFVYFWLKLPAIVTFSQNITVDSAVHLSATSVHCAYQLKIKIRSIIVQALACFSSWASIHSTDMK